MVYSCLAPAYTAVAWGTELPKLSGSLMEAAAGGKAKLVIGDNLCIYD